MTATDQMIAKANHRFPLILGLVGSAAQDLAHPSHVRRAKADSACAICREYGPERHRSITRHYR